MTFRSFFLLMPALLAFSCDENEDPQTASFVDIQTTTTGYTFKKASKKRLKSQYFLGANSDQITLVMYGKHGLRCDIGISQTNISHQPLPYTISNTATGATSCTHASLSIINEQQNDGEVFDANDNVNYLGNTYDGMTFTIESFQNNVITGTVSGPIRTRAGRAQMITTCSFSVAFEFVKR